MSKKILTIFLSLFLIGILSVSCSNADKTGAGDGNSTVDNSKGIEQFNGNTYVSESAIMDSLYLWVSIENGKVAITGADNTSEPSYQGYMDVTGSGTAYSFDPKDDTVAGDLKFTSDGSSVTVTFTKNNPVPGVVGKPFVCNIKK
ncbi:hypothetical protein [Brachyspira pulli]|uniref:hypothetical protein n=1 Tax=Brachyspira pulli TaxID=310721 RepID=UPI00300604FF